MKLDTPMMSSTGTFADVEYIKRYLYEQINKLNIILEQIDKPTETSDECCLPVGFIISTVRKVNPATYLGGTWKKLNSDEDDVYRFKRIK